MLIRAHALLRLSLLAPHALLAQSSTKPVADSVWTWSSRCAKPTSIRLEVRVSGLLLAAPLVPICRVASDSGRVNNEHVRFTFHAARRFQDEYLTTDADTIATDIWQAGADPGVVILGISFSTPKQVLLNSVHLVDPARPKTYVQDRDLTTSSRPLNSSRQPPNER